MKSKRICALLLCCLFLLSPVISGCAPARKPITPQAPAQPRNGTITQQTTNAQAKANKIARACNTVPGVEDSTVVISGNTCYIGLDVEGNLEKGKTESVERACVNKALAADPSVTRCVVASDADTVSRLQNIAQGIRRGTPVSSFADELGEIGRRITPRTKTE